MSSKDNNKVSAEISQCVYSITSTDSSSSNLGQLATLRVDTNYLLEITFFVTALTNNDGEETFNIEIKLDDVSILDGQVEEVGSGSFSQTLFKNNSGGQGRKINVAFTLPETFNEVKEIKMLVNLTPIKHGLSKISVSFNSLDATLTGYDGFSKSITINQVKLPTSTIAFSQSDKVLSWTHVQKADYYKIFVDDQVLKSGGKEVIIDGSIYGSTASQINCKLSNYIEGSHTIKVQAFSNNSSYTASNFSNELSVII